MLASSRKSAKGGGQAKMKKLSRYVGRNVRLDQQAFQAVAQRGKGRGAAQENCFVVAAVSPDMSRLICYGANGRVAVGVSQVALI